MKYPSLVIPAACCAITFDIARREQMRHLCMSVQVVQVGAFTSIHIAVTAALSLKACERFVGVIKAAFAEGAHEA
jgi:hypothetical protein